MSRDRSTGVRRCARIEGRAQTGQTRIKRRTEERVTVRREWEGHRREKRHVGKGKEYLRRRGSGNVLIVHAESPMPGSTRESSTLLSPLPFIFIRPRSFSRSLPAIFFRLCRFRRPLSLSLSPPPPLRFLPVVVVVVVVESSSRCEKFSSEMTERHARVQRSAFQRVYKLREDVLKRRRAQSTKQKTEGKNKKKLLR